MSSGDHGQLSTPKSSSLCEAVAEVIVVVGLARLFSRLLCFLFDICYHLFGGE